jgi:hypothetical protein
MAPRSKGGLWTPPMVQRMLANRAYMGLAYRGAHVNPKAHKAIVTAAEWHAAQLMPVRSAPRGKLPNLLGGIVRCASCRYVLVPKVAGSSMGGTWPSYRCNVRHTAGQCSAPASVNQRRLNEYVEALWRERMAEVAVSVSHDSEALSEAADALSVAQFELSGFAADLTARRLLGDDYHAALETRSAAVKQAKKKMEELAGASSVKDGTIERYDELSIEERKRILGSSIDAVIVTRGHGRIPIEDRVTILWRGEGPDDFPRRGCDNGPIRPYVP